jgi:thymidylate synthase ThyX
MNYNVELLKATLPASQEAGNAYNILISMKLTYPLCIHSEFMTYRRFARNSASLRAIPTKKLIDMVRQYPFIPKFTKNQKGMESNALLSEQLEAENIWLKGRDEAIKTAEKLDALGVAKQDVNRVLAPYLWNTIIATAPFFDWLHLLNQRLKPDADPKFQELALHIKDALRSFTLERSNFHYPFGRFGNKVHDTIVRNVAACARISYLSRGEFTLEQDQELYDRLLSNGHWSPFDHIAEFNESESNDSIWKCWIPYRSKLPQWESYKTIGIYIEAIDHNINMSML